MDKKLKQNIYIGILMFLALVFLFLSYRYDKTIVLTNFIMWVVIAVVAESFLIVSPSTGVGTSVSPAIYLYIAIVANPFVAMVIAILGSILRFPDVEGKRTHFFNTRKNTIVFNVANMAFSVGVCAWIIQLNPSANYFVLVFFALLGLFIAEVVNFIIVAILLFIVWDTRPTEVLLGMAKTLPSTIGIGTLGLFLVFAHNNDPVIVLLFFVPLLLARYSFKLYFESQRMALDTIHALNEALHAKDAYTGGHTGRVEQYAVQLAHAHGLPASDCEIIRTAALLHDIGKIGIPDEILKKPGKLTQDEFEQIQEHSSIGAKILGNVNSLKKVSHIIVQHHERYDGTGYPGGLAGDNISIEASILMISDSYDAMTTDRPYRDALTRAMAISELEKYSGIQFHPELAKTFIDCVLSDEEEKLLNCSDEEVLAKTKYLINNNNELHQDMIQSRPLGHPDPNYQEEESGQFVLNGHAR